MNVEHLAAKMGEPDFVNYVRSFDIFCAMETFTGTSFDFSVLFPEYCAFHGPAVKLSRRGRPSGGVVVLVHRSCLPFVKNIECRYDNMICLKIGKDCVGADRDVILVALYVPPYQSPYYKQSDTNCSIYQLEEFLLNFYQSGDNSYLMVAGDLNARIGSWDLDSDDAFDNACGPEEKDMGSRHSQDTCTNPFGKVLIDFCQTFSCKPLNGNHSGDTDGRFTFVSSQGNSVIDYFLMSAELFSCLDMSFEVGSRVETNHMPLHLTIFMDTQLNSRSTKTKKEKVTTLKWRQENADTFLNEIY